MDWCITPRNSLGASLVSAVPPVTSAEETQTEDMQPSSYRVSHLAEASSPGDVTNEPTKVPSIGVSHSALNPNPPTVVQPDNLLHNQTEPEVPQVN